MKKTWMVTAAVVGSKYIGKYEAETGEEAIELAYADADVSLCHRCARKIENAEVEYMSAECGNDVVSGEETWQDKARAAGWTPPKKGPKKAREKKS